MTYNISIITDHYFDVVNSDISCFSMIYTLYIFILSFLFKENMLVEWNLQRRVPKSVQVQMPNVFLLQERRSLLQRLLFDDQHRIHLDPAGEKLVHSWPSPLPSASQAMKSLFIYFIYKKIIQQSYKYLSH